MTSAESAEIRELRRKNRELEQTIEILKAATGFFARECDPATALICQFTDEKKVEFTVAPICRALSAHGLQIAPRTYWAHQAAAPGNPRSPPGGWAASDVPPKAERAQIMPHRLFPQPQGCRGRLSSWRGQSGKPFRGLP